MHRNSAIHIMVIDAYLLEVVLALVGEVVLQPFYSLAEL